MKNKGLYIILSIVAIGIFAYILNTGSFKRSVSRQDKNNKLTVAASFYPMYFLALEIGKDKVDVYNVTPAGVEPTGYEPTTRDMARIQQSKLLLLLGGNLEAWGKRVQDNLKASDTKTLVVGKPFMSLNYTDENKEKAIDPHVWLSIPLYQKQAELVARALASLDPQNASYYQTNLEVLNRKLQQLDSKFKSALALCKKRDVIASHFAFSYFAKDYNLRQISIAGLSPDAEPSAQNLAGITKFARENDVKYIFFETLVSPRLAKTIANEIGAQTLVLNPMEGFTKEELAQGENYISGMEANLKNLEKALECRK